MSFLKNVSGIVSGHNGDESDKNLLNFLKRHLRTPKSHIWLIRFAFPNAARDQVINEVYPLDNYRKEPDFICIFKDKNFKNINILTINPFSNNFLKKMDSENANNFKITRVKEQILKFIEGIDYLRKKYKQNYIVGCYNSIPLWNLAVIDSGSKFNVLFKSYGLNSSEPGHNTKKELEFESGSDSLLAESFVSYCIDIYTSKDSIFFIDNESIKLFEKSSKWPSLFKSNIILQNTQESNDPFVQKFFACESSYDIEAKCYRIKQQDRDLYNVFKLPSIHPTITVDNIWAGKGICFERIEGHTWFEIIGAFNEQFDTLSSVKKSTISQIHGSLLTQSIQSLYEFRSLIKECKIEETLKTYPYINKINEAINDTKNFIKNTNDQFFDELNQDVLDLSLFLKENSDTVFRDAHIKNRIFKSNKSSLRETIQYLTDIPNESLHELILQNTYDIDFETSKYIVTRWDDICHILLFDCAGILSVDINSNHSNLISEGVQVINILNDVFKLDIRKEDKNIFWQTVLFRATREHLRRVWYANVMPKTYLKRYSKEESSYYLKLAIYSRIQSNSYPYLHQFLHLLHQEHESLFSRVTINNSKFTISPLVDSVNDYKNNSKKLSLEQKVDAIFELISTSNDKDEKKRIKDEIYDSLRLEPGIFGFKVDLKKLFVIIKSSVKGNCSGSQS